MKMINKQNTLLNLSLRKNQLMKKAHHTVYYYYYASFLTKGGPDI